jgi:hypothetical protein
VDAGISAGEEILLSVNTGLQPMWAVWTFIVLILVCVAITTWYSSDSRYR